MQIVCFFYFSSKEIQTKLKHQLMIMFIDDLKLVQTVSVVYSDFLMHQVK